MAVPFSSPGQAVPAPPSRPASALTLSLRLPGPKEGQEDVEDAEQEVHSRGCAAIAAVMREAQLHHAEPRRAELRLGRSGRRRRGRLHGYRAPPPPAARLRPPRPAAPGTWPGSSASAVFSEAPEESPPQSKREARKALWKSRIGFVTSAVPSDRELPHTPPALMAVWDVTASGSKAPR